MNYFEYTQTALIWGLTCRESNGNESEIAKELEAGHPVICSMRPGDFTDIGHFIILTSSNFMTSLLLIPGSLLAPSRIFGMSGFL